MKYIKSSIAITKVNRMNHSIVATKNAKNEEFRCEFSAFLNDDNSASLNKPLPGNNIGEELRQIDFFLNQPSGCVILLQ